jgi:peptidoglycan L-alanyl-D-glutamate endopeptidase CwlK
MPKFLLSKKSTEHMQGIHTNLIKIAERAIQITAIDFGIPENGGLRTEQIQQKLFTAHLSNADGYKNRSKHQDGKALDFYAYVDGKASWEPEYLAYVACAFLQAACELEIKIEWGGLWKNFKDMPHIQLAEN